MQVLHLIVVKDDLMADISDNTATPHEVDPVEIDETPAPVEAAVAADSAIAIVERENLNDLHPDYDFDLLPIVGLGGSAGSVSALQEFFGRIPTNLGIAYVVVMHLAPDYESQLPAILQNRTRMPVVQVQDTVEVEANHVYVIPPAYHLAMDDGKIHLSTPLQPRGKRVAVDLFFRTLATTHRSKAVAIVLSGTDGDGAIGIKRIKEHGGVTVAQDPEEAEYEGMPRAAIETGMVDWILSVEQIAGKITEWINNEWRMRLPSRQTQNKSVAQAGGDEDEVALREVLNFLNTRTGHDFSHYKRGTVLRRIQRRLQVNSLEDIPQYVNFLRTHPGEAGALLQDLLISVTNFFRDPESFAALVPFLPRVFLGKKAGDTVRVWVPGCATGEEAYSLAMLLAEYSETLDSPPEVQIFATDLDDHALHFAREAVYPMTIAADVSPERLRHFFIQDQGRYRLRKEVRERVLFASHNLLRDSPFSRQDLISCRNLLIYFNREAQEKVFGIFHFALQTDGLLFLGSSESADDNPLFGLLDKKHRIYERRPLARLQAPIPALSLPALPRLSTAYLPPILPSLQTRRDDAPNISFGELHLKLLEHAMPPSVLVNDSYEILHLSEHAGKFLRFVGGEVSINLLNVVHPGLRLELRSALFRAVQNGEDIDVPPLLLELDGQKHGVSLRLRPLKTVDDTSSFVLVIFDEHYEPDAIASPPPAPDDVTRNLEEELQHLRAYLRASVEQYEASSEELKASNEELQAMNEEQRSAAEELETSREELQAANEELITVNQELKSNIEELSRANADLQNLMASTDIATVFLNRELRIKRYTPSAVEIFHFIPTDIGRPLADLRHRFDSETISIDADQVLRTLTPVEREVRNNNDRWFLLRITPYRTMEDRIDGVVLTFVDITRRKAAESSLRESETHLRLILESAKDYAIFTNDLERHINSWNSGAQAMFGYTEEEIIGQLADILFTPEDRELGAPQQETQKALATGRAENERWHDRKDGSRFYGSGLVMPLTDDNGNALGFVKIMRDLTESKKAADALKQAKDELEERVLERTAQLENANQMLEREAAERSRIEQAREQLLERLVDVQEEERRRISRELHDQMGQQLTALLIGLQTLPEWPEPGARQPSIPQQIEKLRNLATDLIEHVQRLAWEMRPAALDNLGLEAALLQYVEEWSAQYKTPASFVENSHAAPVQVSEAICVALYRVTQEALNNVQRHAQAKNVSVVLEKTKTSVAIIIEDDGKGFDLETDESGKERTTAQKLGLLGMQERLELVGGTLTIESVPQQGTTIFARVPLTGEGA